MGLSEYEFLNLRSIFIQKNVWKIMWNQISWRGFYQQAFGNEMVEDNGRLKEYLTKIALYSAAETYSYADLEKDIFIGGTRGEGGKDGVVTAALKLRLQKMKLVYQMKEGEGRPTGLTEKELSDCAEKAWRYLADEKVKE